MKFYSSRIYTAINADELQIGSECIFANTLEELRQIVQAVNVEDGTKKSSNWYYDANIKYFVSDKGTWIYAYLIKPPKEPKYRPFESIEEAMKAIKEHDGWVKNSLGTCWLVTGYATKEDINKSVHIASNWVSLDSLYRNYIFADDGTPCGSKIINLLEEQ